MLNEHEKDQKGEVIAYIDAANLDKGIKALGWKIYHKKFRSWLRQKFGVTEAQFFIGLMPEYAGLYTTLQRIGFQLVFKEVLYTKDGAAKGNCDAELVLHAVRDYYERNIRHAILVTSDGDYAPLVKFWQEKRVSCTILAPSMIRKCSWLLRKTNASIVCLNDFRHKLAINEKAPGTDVSAQGPLS